MRNQNAIDFSSQERFIWDKEEKIDVKSLEEIINKYLTSTELQKLQSYAQYYESKNPDILSRYESRKQRNKTPNNFVPTAYYATIVDTMAGYMFQNIQYVADDVVIDTFDEIMKANDSEVKEMETGVRALAYNKAAEIVYTVGDGTTTEIKFVSIDPRNIIFIYNSDIEPVLICGIRIVKSYNPDYDYFIDVIYADEWQYYQMKNDKISERQASKQLYFSECPVVEYRTEVLNDNSSFHSVIPYINALDFIMTGNSNEVERLVDAILVIGKILKDEDLQHMDEWKTLEGMKQEDRAEYITKDMSPEFRQYVSQLLIQEIHKHSHVIDWYSPDSGLKGEVSAKALTTRLFDMNMFSQRIEKTYRKGIFKRIKLISEIANALNKGLSDIEVVFNRTMPNTLIDTAIALKDVPFISDETKLELCGLDTKKEKERFEEQNQGEDVTDEMTRPAGFDREQEETEETPE